MAGRKARQSACRAATRPHQRRARVSCLGIIKTEIRRSTAGDFGLAYRLSEGVIGLITPSPDAYARRMAPLLVSPDLDGRSGAIFDRKGHAVHFAASTARRSGEGVRGRWPAEVPGGCVREARPLSGPAG
jgi:hypothetical protein